MTKPREVIERMNEYTFMTNKGVVHHLFALYNELYQNNGGNPVTKVLLLTPHIAGTSKQAFEKMHKTVWTNILAVSNGERPINIVNGL